MNVYNNPITQIEYSGNNAPAIGANATMTTFAKNPLQSYDMQFIYDGRSTGNFTYFGARIGYNATPKFDPDFANTFINSHCTIDKDFLKAYAMNCIGEPQLFLATQQVSTNFPYEHLWQILEFSFKAKYIVQNSNILLATDNYDGTINDVEQTQLYFSAYKNEAPVGTIAPYNPLNENKVFVINCIDNINKNFTLGAVPYISKNFYDNTMAPNNMKCGFLIYNASENVTVLPKFILEGSIDLLIFFANAFIYENLTVQNQIIAAINAFIAANPVRPYVKITIDAVLISNRQRFHKISATDTSEGAVSYKIEIPQGTLLNLEVMNSLPAPTNIDNT
jgi:hypothetical protein